LDNFVSCAAWQVLLLCKVQSHWLREQTES
jgi:hypothetical protein